MTEKDLNKTAGHPLQTWQWAQFRKAWGNEIIYTKYGIITKHRIPLTKFSIGIFEKGPEPSKEQLTDLKKIGKEHRLIFIKLEPLTPVEIRSSNTDLKNLSDRKNPLLKLLRLSGAIPGKTLFTPTTFWIDLTKPEDNLMKSFSGKTRYNIRLALKKGVVIKEDNSPKAFEKYLELTFETTRRQGFYAHTPKYHKLMWKYLHSEMSSKPIAHLMTAVYKKEIITTWILFTWKDFMYYPYGASTDKYKEVMANNLMMWEAIKFGKKMGLKTFDLWGREEGKGFTKFKEGYNPDVVEFLGSWDLVINKPLYKLYRLTEQLRWKLLKLRKKIV